MAYPPQSGAGYQPPGGYGYQLSPNELRHPHEIPVMICSFATLVALLFLTGLLLNIKFLAGLLLFLVIVAASLYFTGIANVAQYIRIGQTQFPHIFQGLQLSAARLAMPQPEVFIVQYPGFLGRCQDFGRKAGQVLVSTVVVEEFTPAELDFYVARQLGHIKCRHNTLSLLHQQASGDALGAVTALLRQALLVIFSWWNRTAELTADRAGLIGGQDIRAAVTAILKEMVGPQVFARLNLPALEKQIAEMEKGGIGQVAQTLQGVTSPYALNRIRELLRFYKSPLYQNLAGRQGKQGTTMLQVGQGMATGQLYQVISQQAQAQRDAALAQAAQQAAQQAQQPGVPVSAAGPVCAKCGQPLRPGARFCNVCGTPHS